MIQRPIFKNQLYKPVTSMVLEVRLYSKKLHLQLCQWPCIKTKGEKMKNKNKTKKFVTLQEIHKELICKWGIGYQQLII